MRAAAILVGCLLALGACADDSDESKWLVEGRFPLSEAQPTRCGDLDGVTETGSQGSGGAPGGPNVYSQVTGRENADAVADCFREVATGVTVTERESS